MYVFIYIRRFINFEKTQTKISGLNREYSRKTWRIIISVGKEKILRKLTFCFVFHTLCIHNKFIKNKKLILVKYSKKIRLLI